MKHIRKRLKEILIKNTPDISTTIKSIIPVKIILIRNELTSFNS